MMELARTQQEALLVRPQLGALQVGGVDRQRGDDDDRLLVLAHALDRLPERDEARLELVEAQLGHGVILDRSGSPDRISRST